MNGGTIARRLSSAVMVSDTGAEYGVGHATNKYEVLELAYQEYCLREDRGEDVDRLSFCERFPQCQSSLARRLAVHQYLEMNSDLLEDLKEDSWPSPGDSFLHFQLLEELGRGAASRVFLAKENGLGQRRVVVKISEIARAEADTLGRLCHSNIVPVHSVEQDPSTGLVAICMPFLSRTTLEDFIDYAFVKDGPPKDFVAILSSLRNDHRPNELRDQYAVSPSKCEKRPFVDGVLEISVQLFDALAHMHSRGVLHLDLKPSNILLTPSTTPLLLDFNLSADRSVGMGLCGGTLPYMSPEQLRATVLEANVSAHAVDERSDIYSLGIVLFQLLSGRHPFDAVSWKRPSRAAAQELLHWQKEGPPALHRFNPSIDIRIEEFLNRCLSFDPSGRPQNAEEAAEACRKHLAPHRRTERWARAHRWLASLIATAALSISVGSGCAVYWWVTLPPRFERELRAGLQLYQTDDFRGALSHFDAAVRRNPDSADALFARGRARIGVHDYSAALQDFIQAQEISPDGRNYANAAFCAQSQNNFGEAEALYEKAIQSGFRTTAIYNNRGWACFSKAMSIKDYDEADVWFELAIIEDAGLQIAWYNRATCADRAVNFETVGAPMIRRAAKTVLFIKEALAVGPRTPELLTFAARSVRRHAFLCREYTVDNPILTDGPVVTSVLDYLDEAIDEGMNPKDEADLGEWQRSTPEIANHPRFVQMMQRTPSKSSPPNQSRLLDPVDGISHLVGLY